MSIIVGGHVLGASVADDLGSLAQIDAALAQDDTIKVGAAGDLRGRLHRARRGRHARRETGAPAAQQHGRRQEDRVGRPARPTPRRTAPSMPRASWSSRTSVQIARRPALGRRGPRGQELRQDPAAASPSSTARRPRRTRRSAIRRRTSSASPPTAPSGWPGLGDYAFTNKGYKKVATVAEDYSFPYTQVFGFMAGFCKAGGHVVSKSWVPIGNKDYSSVDRRDPGRRRRGLCRARRRRRRQLPAPVPAGRRHRAADRRLDHRRPDRAQLARASSRTLSSACRRPARSPTPGTTPRWTNFVAAYKAAFPDGFPSPSLFAHGYYVNTEGHAPRPRAGQAATSPTAAPSSARRSPKL